MDTGQLTSSGVGTMCNGENCRLVLVVEERLKGETAARKKSDRRAEELFDKLFGKVDAIAVDAAWSKGRSIGGGAIGGSIVAAIAAVAVVAMKGYVG